jgi:putative membrane protein
MISHRCYLAVLGALFAALWIALAIAPRYRQDWALELELPLGPVLFFPPTAGDKRCNS